MTRFIPLLAAVCLLPGSTLLAQTPSPAGTLIIIGGALRTDNSDVWNRIIQHASEAKPQAVSATTEAYRPKIAVFPAASADPMRSGKSVSEALERYGAETFIVPLAPTNTDRDPREAARDKMLIDQVKAADGVYFTGGSQARITAVLREADGSDTPMLEAVWEVYRRGGVIAGSSAGAAIMSKVMYRDAKKVLGTMQNGVTMGREVDHGLGFLDPAWFVEQHTLARGRFALALVAMQTNDIKFGVGVDENTAVVVKNDGFEVVGKRGVIVMDISEAKADPDVKAFNVKNVKLTYLGHGDMLSLSTREVTPSTDKQEGSKLDPSSPDFDPDDDDEIFSNDVLGNTTAVELMCRLMRNRRSEAHGLAFDAAAAKEGPSQGFEFRFYRGDDTFGWCCSRQGDEVYTVRNVRLDIRPIEIAGPLYR